MTSILERFDAVVAEIVSLRNELGGTPARGTPGPGPGISIPPVVDTTGKFWNPSPEQTAAFVQKMNLKPADLLPWTQNPDGSIQKGSPTSFPVLKALALTDVEGAKEYAGFGYAPDGTQRLSTLKGFVDARTMADRLNAAETVEQIEYVMTGSGGPGVETDAVIYACMTGLVTFGMGSVTFGKDAGTIGKRTILELIANLYKTSPRKPGDAGASGI